MFICVQLNQRTKSLYPIFFSNLKMVSHQHQVIFVHIPKCGGQSIETMFLEDLGLTWDLREPLLLRRNQSNKLGPPYLAHLLARDYVKYKWISEVIFNTYYKFSIVRNPFLRTISIYNYLFGGNQNNSRMLSFDSFINEWLPNQFPNGVNGVNVNSYYYFVRSQSDFVYSKNNIQLVDKIYRFEDIQFVALQLIEKLNLKSNFKHINKTESKIITPNDLNLDYKKKIYSIYEKDFINFGYDFDIK